MSNESNSGSDSFTYQAYAGMQTSNTATVTLTVTAPPAPIANNDSYIVTNGALTTTAANGVLANDSNPTGQPMTAALVVPASHGMVMLNADGSFTYSGSSGFSGTDSFTYQDSAGGQTSNVATVTLTVSATPPPTANDDAYTLPADGTPLVVSATSGVLANDVSPSGQPLVAVLTSQPSNGTVMLNSDGSFTYTASPNR